MKPRIFHFIPALLWIIVIYILLVMPASDIPSIPLLDEIDFDKFVHAGLFAVLVFLISFPFRKDLPKNAGVYVVIAILCCCYGIAMEYVQKYFTTDRDFDVLDMAADGFGCLIGYLFIQWLLRRMIKKDIKEAAEKL